MNYTTDYAITYNPNIKEKINYLTISNFLTQLILYFEDFLTNNKTINQQSRQIFTYILNDLIFIKSNFINNNTNNTNNIYNIYTKIKEALTYLQTNKNLFLN